MYSNEISEFLLLTTGNVFYEILKLFLYMYNENIVSIIHVQIGISDKDQSVLLVHSTQVLNLVYVLLFDFTIYIISKI